MKKILKELFSDGSGVLSSKRVLGAIVLLFAMVLTIVIIMSGQSGEPYLRWSYTTGTALLSGGVLEKFAPGTQGKR